MHVSYFSSQNGDELNKEFQQLLLDDDRFHEIAGDIFLFSTKAFYDREKEVRVNQILEKKPALTNEDRLVIDEKIRVEKSITRVNSGDMDLMYSDSSSERLIQVALSFLIANSSRVDYIAGLKRAKAMGFDLPVDADVLENGVPLRVQF